MGATDVRVNQHQVNAEGRRVGINRPDIQFTDARGTITGTPGTRVYVEYDKRTSNRGPEHRERILANDPDAHVILIVQD